MACSKTNNPDEIQSHLLLVQKLTVITGDVNFWFGVDASSSAEIPEDSPWVDMLVVSCIGDPSNPRVTLGQAEIIGVLSKLFQALRQRQNTVRASLFALIPARYRRFSVHQIHDERDLEKNNRLCLCPSSKNTLR
jgi:hypothetical protein